MGEASTWNHSMRWEVCGYVYDGTVRTRWGKLCSIGKVENRTREKRVRLARGWSSTCSAFRSCSCELTLNLDCLPKRASYSPMRRQRRQRRLGIHLGRDRRYITSRLCILSISTEYRSSIYVIRDTTRNRRSLLLCPEHGRSFGRAE